MKSVYNVLKRQEIKIGGISLDYRDDWDILGMVEIYALNIYHTENDQTWRYCS